MFEWERERARRKIGAENTRINWAEKRDEDEEFRISSELLVGSASNH
jgi:hypothetical protein